MARNTNREQSVATRQAFLRERNKSITARFNELYNQQRKRYDDCLLAISREFFLEQRTVLQILSSKQKPEPMPDKKQMGIFG